MGNSVSVILAAYNAEKYIRHALDSALLQTRRDFEIIVVDDASTDRTADIAATFAVQDNRVRLIRVATNQGPAHARNLALDVANGDWVTILDADDRFLQHRLATLLDYAQRFEADFIADNILLAEVMSGRSLGVMFPDIRSPRFVSPLEFVANNTPGNTKKKYGLLKPLMRRSFLGENALRYDEHARFASDFLFYFEALLKDGRFLVVPEPMYAYSLTPDAITRVRTVEHMRYAADQFRRFRHHPRVASDVALTAALENRSRLLDLDIAFHVVTEPLRQKRPYESVRRLMRNVEVLPYVCVRLAKSAHFRLSRHLKSAIDFPRPGWIRGTPAEAMPPPLSRGTAKARESSVGPRNPS